MSPTSIQVKAPTRHSSEELRANVLGVGVHAVDLNQAVERIEEAVLEGQAGYVCVTGVHGVMEAQRDPKLKQILDRALLVTPDGMPTVWVGRAQGLRKIRRVFGPDLMLELSRRSVGKGFTHFLYGGQSGVAEELQKQLERRFPGIRIVGTFTPPFRPLQADEVADLKSQIATCRPDIIWVGLSTPKQECFMAEFLSHLTSGVMIGVGAAFDFHTGRIKDAPNWMKISGLQWFHRTLQEPARLWKRYLLNNSHFVWKIFLQFSGLTSYELHSE